MDTEKPWELISCSWKLLLLVQPGGALWFGVTGPGFVKMKPKILFNPLWWNPNLSGPLMQCGDGLPNRQIEFVGCSWNTWLWKRSQWSCHVFKFQYVSSLWTWSVFIKKKKWSMWVPSMFTQCCALAYLFALSEVVPLCSCTLSWCLIVLFVLVSFRHQGHGFRAAE